MQRSRHSWLIVAAACVVMIIAVLWVMVYRDVERANDVAGIFTLLLTIIVLFATFELYQRNAPTTDTTHPVSTSSHQPSRPSGLLAGVVLSAALVGLIFTVAVVAMPNRKTSGSTKASPSLPPDGCRAPAAGYRRGDGGTAVEGRVLGDHQGALSVIAFRPDGRVLASGGGDHHLVRLWDVTTDPPGTQSLSGHISAVANLAFSSDGGLLASTAFDDPNVLIWETAAGRPAGVGKISVGSVGGGIAFSPNGVLAVGEVDKVSFGDPILGRQLGTSLAHKGKIRSLAFNREGTMLVSGSYDGTIRFWDMGQRRAIGQLVIANGGGSIVDLAFSPDGQLLATAGHAQKTIQLLAVPTGQSLMKPVTFDREAWGVAFSPDGKILAAAGSNRVQRIDTSTGLLVGAPLTGHSAMVTTVAFSCSGLLATGSHDAKILLWSQF